MYKKIRNFIKLKKYNEIPNYIITNNIQISNLDYLNSILSGISKIDNWNVDINFEDFISNIVDKTNFLWNETTYTAIIGIYSNKLINNFSKAVYYLNEMIKKILILKLEH